MSVRRRKLRGQPCLHRGEIGLRGPRGHALFQAANGAIPTGIPKSHNDRPQLGRNPKVDIGPWESHGIRHDADHRIAEIAVAERFAEDLGICPEAPPPETFADDSGVGSVEQIFLLTRRRIVATRALRSASPANRRRFPRHFRHKLPKSRKRTDSFGPTLQSGSARGPHALTFPAYWIRTVTSDGRHSGRAAASARPRRSRKR
jgi:hypothetical protein